MTTEGPFFPGSANAGAGWIRVTNTTSDNVPNGTNDTNAAISPTVTSGYSTFFRVTNFSFSIPSDAIITNIEFVTYGRRIQQALLPPGHKYRLWVGSDAGDEKGVISEFSTSYSSSSKSTASGSPTSYWNYSITPAQVNAITFGVSFRFGIVISGTEQVGINYISAAVTYVLPSGESSTTKRLMPIELIGDK